METCSNLSTYVMVNNSFCLQRTFDNIQLMHLLRLTSGFVSPRTVMFRRVEYHFRGLTYPDVNLKMHQLFYYMTLSLFSWFYYMTSRLGVKFSHFFQFLFLSVRADVKMSWATFSSFCFGCLSALTNPDVYLSWAKIWSSQVDIKICHNR